MLAPSRAAVKSRRPATPVRKLAWMRTRTTDALPLAPRPSLERYRKLARDLVLAGRAGDGGTVREWAAGWLARLGQEHVEREAQRIVEEARRMRLLRPRPPLAAARLCVARLHGFSSWAGFVGHVEALARPRSPVAQFESAADAVVAGDLAVVERLIRANPRLVRARSTRRHRATLLHYVAANGHEGFRQRTPRNAVAVARVLLQAGAKADALAHMYGHRCTTLQMLVSSVHPHAAGLQESLVETLLDFGAAVDGVEGDGSPLMTALRFHYPKAAETLVRRGARVDNVISAAALGRADLVDAFVDEAGRLRPHVPLAPGPWPTLPKDPRVHLGYALTWACSFGRREVVELMLRKGVDVSGRDDDATALHFAAAFGRMELVRLLLKHGASLEALNSYDGTVLDGTVWYALNAPIESVDYSAVVRELLGAGAKVDVYPQMKAYVDAVLAGRRGGGYPDP